MKHALALIIAIAALLTAFPAAAQDIDTREHIEVVGLGELKVVPNEFVVRSNITNFHKSLKTASAENDAAVAQVFRDVSKLGVARKYIVTDQIVVDTVTEGYRERGNYRRLGYSVSRDIMVVLHDATKIEPTMREMFEAGVDRLTVSTGHTEMNDLLENAQIKAATTARKKAKLLSSALGRTLGKAVAISEEAPGRNPAQNFVYTADTPDLGDTISLGKISVQSSARVKFLLK